MYLSSNYSTKIKQDFAPSQCKIRKAFCTLPDEFVSLDGFKSFEFSDPYHIYVTAQKMPPSLCHFTWINTALNGFRLGNTPTSIITYSENDTYKHHGITLQEQHISLLRPNNTTLPTTAIMGGSIIATLRAWNDPNVYFFHQSQLFSSNLTSLQYKTNNFTQTKWELMYFETSSVFQ